MVTCMNCGGPGYNLTDCIGAEGVTYGKRPCWGEAPLHRGWPLLFLLQSPPFPSFSFSVSFILLYFFLLCFMSLSSFFSSSLPPPRSSVRPTPSFRIFSCVKCVRVSVVSMRRRTKAVASKRRRAKVVASKRRRAHVQLYLRALPFIVMNQSLPWEKLCRRYMIGHITVGS